MDDGHRNARLLARRYDAARRAWLHERVFSPLMATFDAWAAPRDRT